MQASVRSRRIFTFPFSLDLTALSSISILLLTIRYLYTHIYLPLKNEKNAYEKHTGHKTLPYEFRFRQIARLPPIHPTLKDKKKKGKKTPK